MKPSFAFFTSIFVVTLVCAVPVEQTCPCKKQTDVKVSTCARHLGDPTWCVIHICATGYECVSQDQSTHTCVTKQTTGTYVCRVGQDGEIVKPLPDDDTRCKCDYLQDRVVTHVTPKK